MSASSLTCPLQAYADEAITAGESLTFESAARQAVSWHPSIVMASARLNEMGQEVDIAKAGYFPQISAGVGSGYDTTNRSRWRPRASLRASQMIWDFGKVSSDVSAQRAGTRVTRAQVLIAVDKILRDTSLSMIEVQRGQALLKVARAQLENISAIILLVEERYERGAATRSDLLQTQSRFDAARSTILQIEAEQRRWRSNLGHLLGRKRVPDVADAMPRAFDRACLMLEVPWDNVPAIMQAEAEQDRAIAEQRRARVERLPTLSVGAGAETEFRRPFNDDRTDYNVGISLSTNLFSGGATSARLRGSDFAVGAANAALDNTRLEVTSALAEAREQITVLLDRLGTLHEQHLKMRETGELYRLQYLEMGTRTLVDLLNAQQELHQIRFDAVNSEYDLRRLNAECLYGTGQLRKALDLEGMWVEGVSL